MQLLTLLTIASRLYLLIAITTTVVHAANAAAMVCPNTEATDDNVENTIVDAQAYKPNAPIKTRVCEESNDGSSSGGGPHKLAHWSFWRSNYKDLIPIFFTGNIYSCSSSGGDDVKPITTTGDEDSVVVMEVWQPRPDGTYSSIRPGVEEGDCRASVPVTLFTQQQQQQQQHDENDEDENNNVDDRGRIGTVKFDTFIPGSTGILNGLVPSSSSSYNDYPPYKSGSIHLFLNIQGYTPLVVSLNMNELENWFSKRHYVGKKRFQLSGDKKKKKSGNNGMEIQSVTPRTTNSSRSSGKYNLAIDLEVNFFLTKSNNNHDDNERKRKKKKKKKKGVAAAAAAGGGDATTTLKDIFCSKKKKSLLFGRIISFFKEPISVCSPAYLDFFAL